MKNQSIDKMLTYLQFCVILKKKNKTNKKLLLKYTSFLIIYISVDQHF